LHFISFDNAMYLRRVVTTLFDTNNCCNGKSGKKKIELIELCKTEPVISYICKSLIGIFLETSHCLAFCFAACNQSTASGLREIRIISFNECPYKLRNHPVDIAFYSKSIT